MPDRRAMVDVAGKRMEATAILFIKRDMNAAAPISAAIKRASLFPANRITRSPIWSATPVTSSPCARTKIAKMVMTAVSESPENTSWGVRTRLSPSATSTRSATKSTVSRSLRNRIIAAARIAKVMTRSGFVVTLLTSWNQGSSAAPIRLGIIKAGSLPASRKTLCMAGKLLTSITYFCDPDRK